MKQIVFKLSCFMMIISVASLSTLSSELNAATSGGSSSSASSSARGSTSSSSSMSRSSAVNASRNAQQSSQRAAQQAAKSNSMSSNKVASKYHQSTRNQQFKSRSMMLSKRPYSSGTTYSSQFVTTSYYNNWLYFYLFASMSQNQHEKKNNIDYQMNMLKQQMKPHEKLYTITVQTKHGKRVVVVSKKQYDQIKTGQHIKIKNGIV